MPGADNRSTGNSNGTANGHYKAKHDRAKHDRAKHDGAKHDGAKQGKGHAKGKGRR